jgi:hypothetical protein
MTRKPPATSAVQSDILPGFLWDVVRWFRSDTFMRSPLDVQAAYLNLCFSSFARQPDLFLPDDDALLWRAAGAPSLEAWRELRPRVLADPWILRPEGWWHPVVAQTYEDSRTKSYGRNRAARIAGRASAEARRKLAESVRSNGRSTNDEQTLNERPTQTQRSSTNRSRSRTTANVEPTSPAKHHSAGEVGHGSVGNDETAVVPDPPALPAQDDDVARSVLVPPGDPVLALALSYGSMADEVFSYFQLRLEHPRAQLTADRKRVLEARLREEPGDTAQKVAGLKKAIDGAVLDPWYNGAETGRKLWDFDNVFVNKGRNRIEKLQASFDKYKGGGGTPPPALRGKNQAVSAAFLAAKKEPDGEF